MLPTAAPVTPRPSMPTAADQIRASQQGARYKVLTGDWLDLLTEDMSTRIDPDRLTQWGAGDTSSNVLADMSRQWSTPGLYGSRPSVSHADPVTSAYTGPGGWVDQCGYWTAMQVVQYLTTGIGDYCVRYDADAGGLSFRLVCPSDVWVWSTQDRPDVPVILWELRQRYVTVGKMSRWCYAWDQFDRGEVAPDGTEVRPPSFRVVECGGLNDGGDITNLVIPGAPVGGYVGEAYPFRRANRAPFLPWVVYRSCESKQQWNIWQRRDAMRGTLNAATYATYSGHCARDASGTAVIAAGLNPIIGDVKNVGGNDKVLSINLTPGAILYHSVQEGAQPFVSEVGPGGNLSEVSQYEHAYELKQLRRWGLSADDVQKSSADPASGAALYISNQSKRQYAEMVRPVYLRSDLEALSIMAALLRLAGLGDYPESGYSISYASIPKSKDEEQQERDQIDWDLEHGHISELEAYMRRNPGTTESDAMAALTKSAVDKARLDKARTDAVAAAGLAPEPTDPADGGESSPSDPTVT